MNKIPMTAEGYSKLQDELKKLTSEDRPKIIEAIHEKIVSSFKIKRTKSDGDVITKLAINRKRNDNPKSKSAPNVLAEHNLKKAGVTEVIRISSITGKGLKSLLGKVSKIIVNYDKSETNISHVH